MQSLYAEYLLEKTDHMIIEIPEGFITYKYINQSVYMMDLYIRPEFRKMGFSTKLMNAVVKEAKDKGCVELLGSIIPSNKNSTESLRVFLKNDVILVSASNDFIVLRKDI